MAAPHFDAQLSPGPGPHVSLGSPELSFVTTSMRSSRVLGLTLLISSSQIARHRQSHGASSVLSACKWISVLLPEIIQCPKDLDRNICCKLGPSWHLKRHLSIAMVISTLRLVSTSV